MAHFGRSSERQDFARAVADGRNREHALSIRAAPEQPDEPMLDRPAVAGRTNRDAGHPGSPMDGRDRLGSGDDPFVIARLRRRGRIRRVEAGIGPVLAELGPRLQPECRRAVRIEQPIETGGTEEHEVLPTEPLQQWIVVGDRAHPVPHLLEVGHDAVDVMDRSDHVGLQASFEVGCAPVEFDQHPRLGHAIRVPTFADVVAGCGVVEADDLVVAVAEEGQRRVDEEVDAEAVTIEDHAHRVDEERDVVGDEHQHGPFGAPTVSVGLR